MTGIREGDSPRDDSVRTVPALLCQARREGDLHRGQGLRHRTALLRGVGVLLKRRVVEPGHDRLGIEIDRDADPSPTFSMCTFAVVRMDCGG